MRQLIPPSISKACPTSLVMSSSQLSLQKNATVSSSDRVLHRHQDTMRDKPPDITHRYEQAVRDTFASDFVHTCADVEWSFLAQKAGGFLVKPPVVRREALICYLSAGQVHPNLRCSERRKTLECPDLPRRSEDEDGLPSPRIPRAQGASVYEPHRQTRHGIAPRTDSSKPVSAEQHSVDPTEECRSFRSGVCHPPEGLLDSAACCLTSVVFPAPASKSPSIVRDGRAPFLAWRRHRNQSADA